MFKFVLSFLLASVSFNALAAECATDEFFRSQGWTIHDATQFNRYQKTVLAAFEAAQKDYVADTEGIVYAPIEERYLHVKSYDNLTTPRPEMFGDLILIADQFTSQLLELRWYSQGQKNLIFDSSALSCASPVIPTARNTLFSRSRVGVHY